MVSSQYVKKSDAKAFFKQTRIVLSFVAILFAVMPALLWSVISFEYESTLEIVQNIWKLRMNLPMPFILEYGGGIIGILLGLGICFAGYILFSKRITKFFDKKFSKFDSLSENELINTSELSGWLPVILAVLLFCFPLAGLLIFNLAAQANKDYLDAYEQIYNSSINHQQ